MKGNSFSQKIDFFPRNHLFRSEHVHVFWNPKMLLWTLRMQFWDSRREIFAQSLKINTKIKLFQKKILKILLWTCRMQFWQTCRKFLPKVWKIFIESRKESFFFNFFLPELSSGKVECICDSRAENLYLKLEDCPLNVRKNSEVIIF